MRNICTCLLLALLLAAPSLRGEPAPAEQRALAEAENLFNLGFWERAEKKFDAFAGKFPKSESRPQAVLRQAQARLHLNRFAAAAELLTARQRDAGKFADEYLFWLGEAQYQATNYAAAA
jgi:TolA-binding protein